MGFIKVTGLSDTEATKYRKPKAKKKPSPATSKRKPSAKKSEAQRGASASGFHTLNLYQNCQRKYFLRTIARLEPTGRGTAYPLLFGTAFHEAKDVFYRTKSLSKGLTRLENTLIELHDEFESENEFDVARERGPMLFKAWHRKFGQHDHDRFEILGVEKRLETTLPGGKYQLTGRIDLLVRYENSVWIIDTKTAGFSKRTAEEAISLGDQATAYIYLVRECLGLRADGVIGDIAYWNKQSGDPNNIDCFRTDIIARDDRQLAEFALGAAQTNSEISQKFAALKAGHDPAIFTRNTHYCMSFFRKCEFAEICRTQVNAKGRAPSGYRRNPKIKPGVTQFIYDETEGLL